jgi:hypothetical protein
MLRLSDLSSCALRGETLDSNLARVDETVTPNYLIIEHVARNKICEES